MTGWGILGIGRVADLSVAPAIAKLADGHLVASVGREPAKARQFASKHGGAAYATYEELLADEDVDIVYIATPNVLHAEQIISAARAGKHVFAEKPLATSAADARRAIEAVDRCGVKLGVNFQTRFHKGMSDIRSAIETGEIGECLIVECEVSSGRGELSGWRADARVSGLGAINNVGVHAYDLVRYLLASEVVEVCVLTNVGRRDELEMTTLAMMRFNNGTLAYVNANQSVPNFQPDLRIYGSSGRILGRSITRPFLQDAEIAVLAADRERRIKTSTTDAFDRSVSAFQRAVLEDTQPVASGYDGLRSVELTEAMSRSAREGRAVPVSSA